MEREFETKRIFQHLDELCYSIGPRPAGSEAERLASEYVRSRFAEAGLKTKTHRFIFWKPERWLPCLFLPPVLAFFSRTACLVTWLAATVFLATRRGRSVIVSASQWRKPKIVIGAQLDSGPVPPVGILKLYLPLSSLLVALWFFLIEWNFFPLLVVAPLLSFFTKRSRSPGATDASGLALLLELCERHKEGVIFAAAGAGERRRAGLRELCRIFQGKTVIWLERIGKGKLIVQERGTQLSRKLNLPNAGPPPLRSPLCLIRSDAPHEDAADDLPEKVSAANLERLGKTMLKWLSQFSDASLKEDRRK